MVSKPIRSGRPSSGVLLRYCWSHLPRGSCCFANWILGCLMAAGFTCMAFAACLNAEYTTAWSAANYYRTELLMGVGQAFAFIGLVGCIILQGIFSGGLAKPQWILTFSAFFHTIRLFGGTTGAVYMGHFLAEREKLHSNLLGSARHQRKLDYGRKSSRVGGGRLRKVIWCWLRLPRVLSI